MQPPVDDLSIKDEEVLWRRIRPEWIQTIDGVTRPTGQAFKDRLSGELSTYIANLADVERILAMYPDDSLVSITAGFVRSFGYAIVHDPILNDPVLPDEPSHALICPAPKGSAASQMARQAQWVRLRTP